MVSFSAGPQHNNPGRRPALLLTLRLGPPAVAGLYLLGALVASSEAGGRRQQRVREFSKSPVKADAQIPALPGENLCRSPMPSRGNWKPG